MVCFSRFHACRYSVRKSYFWVSITPTKPPTSDVSEIPWATRQLEAPTSEGEHAQHHGGGAVRYTNDSQMTIAQLEKKSIR